MKRWPVPLVLCLLLVSGTARGQDAHYWTNQYGARASLLGGVVVGALLDLSSVYYNPGALSLIPDPSLLVGTEALELITIRFDDALGQDRDLSTVQFRPAPSFFGITMAKRWVFSVLTRYDFEIKVDGRQIGENPGRDFAAEVIYDQRLSESWGGLTWSHEATKDVGVGISTFAAIRTQRGRLQGLVEGISDTAGAGANVFADDFDYWNLRLLWKIGVAWELDPVSLGLTITTPSLGLFGSGRVGFNAFSTGVDVDGETILDPVLTADFQKDLPSTYKSPPSVAVGASYHFKNTTVYASAEWFDAVESFAVLSPEPWVGQTSGDTLNSDLNLAYQSVLNYGVGLNQELGGKTKVYASFTTDFSARVPGSTSPIPVSSWNLYHFTLGGDFTFGNAAFTVGLGYAFGDNRFLSDIDIDRPTAPEARVSDVRYQRLKLIIGFNFLL